MLRVAAFSCFLFGLGALGRAEDWPQFLGPNRNGIASEKGLVRSWKENGPKVLWRIEGGVGMSGVVVREGVAFTMAHRGGEQTLLAIGAENGKSAWETPIAPEYRNQMGNGTRATPVVDGDRVVVFTGEGILAAVHRSTGKVLWSRNVVSDAMGEPADYGMASSPLVVDGKVIVHLGVADNSIAAFEVENGKPAWSTGSDPAGYSSPTLLTLHGKPHLVSFVGASLTGMDPASGKVLWRYPFETDFGCNIATPIAVDGGVYISAGENHGGTLLDIEPSADGFTPKERWTSFGPSSVLRCEWQTPLLIDGHLYGFDNVGGAGPVSHLACIEAKTGKRVWQKTRFGKGNAVAADGVLYILTFDGQLVTIAATPKGYSEIARAKVSDKTRTAPSLANGLLYLRDDKEIICLDLRQK